MKFNHKLLKEIRIPYMMMYFKTSKCMTRQRFSKPDISEMSGELLDITLITRQTSHLNAKVLRYSGKKQVFYLLL